MFLETRHGHHQSHDSSLLARISFANVGVLEAYCSYRRVVARHMYKVHTCTYS